MSFFLFLLLLFVLLARPQDFFPALGSLRLALTLTVLTTVTTLPHISGRIGSIVGSRTSRWYLVFFITMVLSIPFASHRRFAFDFVILVYLSNMLFYFLFLAHIDSLRKLQAAMLTISVSAFFFAVCSARSGEIRGGRFVAGQMFDPNGLAFFFLSLLPLSIPLLLGKTRLLSKLFGAVVGCLSIGIILLTGSRGGMVGLLSVLVFIGLRKWPGVGWPSKALLALLSLGALAFFHEKINLDRYLSLANVATDYNVTAESGRFGIWREALELVMSNPLTGVGVQCFPKAIGEKRAAEGELPKWQSPHNFLVQILTEVGVVGFGYFCAVILRNLRDLSRCRTQSCAVPGGEDLGLIAASVQAAFVGLLITAFFLSEGYSVLFTLFFALSCCIGRLCDEQVSDGFRVVPAH